jgi:type I restriction enzyme S subunit
MGDVWTQTTLGETVEVTMGRQRSPKHATGTHVMPYLRAANVKDGRLELDDVLEMNFTPEEQAKFALREGDVLVTEGCGSIAQLGASAAWNGDLPGTVCFQNTLLRLRARPGITLPGFVEVWARHAHHSGLWAAIASGTNIFHIGSRRAETAPVLLPPLAEQRRIVDLVGSLDREHTAAGAVMAEADELLRSLRDALVAGPQRRLGDLIEDIDGGTSPVTEARPPLPGERAVLKLSAVRNGRLDATEAKAVSETTVLRSASVVRRGDVLITRSNTPDRVGDVAFADADHPTLHLSDLTLRIHASPSLLDAEYLTHALLSTDLRRAVRASASGTSSSMKKISRSKIREYLIPTPPLTVQKEIAATLGVAADLVAAAERQRRAAEVARACVVRSTLAGAFGIPRSYDSLLDQAG